MLTPFEKEAIIWEAIGTRSVKLAQKWANGVVHAIRTRARGYGLRRTRWEVTTECGRILYRGHGWQRHDGLLRDTTCASCRNIVRDKYDRDFDENRVEDALVEYEGFLQEESWRIQAEWHKPDPIVIPVYPSGAYTYVYD